jgi:hypothetical protein
MHADGSSDIWSRNGEELGETESFDDSGLIWSRLRPLRSHFKQGNPTNTVNRLPVTRSEQSRYFLRPQHSVY